MQRFDYSKIDVAQFLNELGLNRIQKRGKDWWFSCPLPEHIGEDRTPSISMEEGSTRTYCFGCNFAGNAVSFLAELEGVSPLRARYWLRERFNIGVFDEENFSSQIKKKMERLEKRIANPVGQNKQFARILSEEEIEKRYINWELIKEQNAKPFSYMLDRGFSIDTLEEWQIGWDDISQGFSIPIRNREKELLGFKVRFPYNAIPRYKYLGGPEYGFDTLPAQKYLFGIDKYKRVEEIDPEWGSWPSIIVTEGELNAISLHQKGFTNAVGISGRNISDHQLNLIKDFSNVTFIFDDQKDSITAAKSVNKVIPAYIIPEHDKDPADMTEKEIIELFEHRESTVML